jgi:hypothetical protein
MINNVFYNLPEKNPETNLENDGTWECVPIFLSIDQTPCPERHKNERSELVHHETEELFPQGHNTKQCSPSKPEKYHHSL